MDIELFNYELPERLIAQLPLSKRTASRLLTLHKETGAIAHHMFEELPNFLNPGDLLVLNDTRVIPARLFGVKEGTGAKVEVLLLTQIEENRWEALVKPGKRVKTGTVIHIGSLGTDDDYDDQPLLKGVVEEESEMGGRTIRFEYNGIFNEILDRLGSMPLPPYIKKQLEDKERYQTVYAKHEGSAAAPTAGLHFTNEFLGALQLNGIRIAYITLHVGLGTFRPVSTESVAEHRMHSEYYKIPEETASLIETTREEGGRVIAVGTTSARALEAASGVNERSERPQALEGWTDIFIYPGYTFRVIDAMLTNFHLPKSTLLMLISAMAGRENVLQAYEEAVQRDYRFFSFGDAMFIY